MARRRAHAHRLVLLVRGLGPSGLRGMGCQEGRAWRSLFEAAVERAFFLVVVEVPVLFSSTVLLSYRPGGSVRFPAPSRHPCSSAFLFVFDV